MKEVFAKLNEGDQTQRLYCTEYHIVLCTPNVFDQITRSLLHILYGTNESPCTYSLPTFIKTIERGGVQLTLSLLKHHFAIEHCLP